MGFDNECILNIQSLAGEYFCPVCRTLIYPHEALQTQCTHLYCKPCLSYIVSSTQACPYDGYLVTEAGSKPLLESNKALAETIGKTTVHCLYHRSGCVWQGPLSDCPAHCSGCAFGNSPVVCNKCGIQIVHRQVQEHAQTCNVNGANTQPLGSETAQNAASSGIVSTDQSKITNQAVAPPSASQPQTVGPTSAQNLNPPATTNPLPQAMPAPAVPTPEQQYYQQYQQYYQQYPGYDPYQQPYQQYYPYQQPAQQVQQPSIQPQLQPQLQQQVQAPVQQVQPPAQNYPLAQTQGPPQHQTQSQAQSHAPANGQPQPLYPQAVVVSSSQNHGQVNSQPLGHSGQPVAHGQMPLQPYSQIQPHLVQNHAQPPMQAPPYQQPHAQIQPSQMQPYPQTQPQPQPQSYPQPHSHFQPQPQPQLQPIKPQLPQVVHPPYPQIPHATPQQHPMQVQTPPGSLLPPPPPSHMHPPQAPHMLPPQQRPAFHQVQQPMPPQYMQQPQAFPGQTPGQLQGQPHSGPFAHQHPQVRPPALPQPMQQPSSGFVQPQQGNVLPPQSYVGRPAMLNQGCQPQQYPQSSGSAGIPPPARPPQFGSTQLPVTQSNVSLVNQQHVYSDQQHNQYAPPSGGDQTFERRAEQQEDKSPSLKKSEPLINEVKPEAVMNDENSRRKDETSVKDAVSELHQGQGVPGGSATAHRVKEESKDDLAVATVDSAKQSVNFQGSSQADNAPFSQSQTTPKGTERSSHPPVPYGLPGQQQKSVAPMGQSPSQLRPTGQGYLPHGPHPGDQYQAPGTNQPLAFPPEVPSGGPNNSSRGYEPPSSGHGRISRMSQGDSLGPPLPHGLDGPPVPRHSGPMESDMYQNQRPPHFDSRRQDSHFSGNLEVGAQGPPYSSESNPARMNGGPPRGYDEKFRTPDNFSMPPTRHRDESFKQFPGPPHLGSEDNTKFGSHLARPFGGYGMDGPPRFYDKDPHGYGYDAGPRLPPYHPSESGGRPLPPNIHIHDDYRGRFDNNRQNADFFGPMHGFGRHHMGRLPPTSPRNPFTMERQPFAERFPVGPPGHMHRGEFDVPGKLWNGEPFGPRNLSGRGEPGFGPPHDYGRAGEPNGPGGFSHQPRFGDPFGSKSSRPHLGEPGFRSGYQGFPSDGGYYEGGPDSFDPLMKRKTFSMGWCRICKVDCESVEGLEIHGQTSEHQRMSMDMVISIKKKNAKRQKTTSIEREEAGKFRNSETHACGDVS